jgi:UDP-glucose 4-epimerase
VDNKFTRTINRVLLTGGAGFLGSHLADALMERNLDVTILDNLTSGTLSNIEKHLHSPNFWFAKSNLSDMESIARSLIGIDTVFHVAANPEVRAGYRYPEIAFEENIRGTFCLLESVRKSNVKNLFFTSSSTVYGEPAFIPTPEDYAPLLPISMYGASKMACEALISSYSNNYGINSIIFRLANVIGARSKHGIILDFVDKALKCTSKFEILGDGTQNKSYVHVTDCVNCILTCADQTNGLVEVINVGSEDTIDVLSIARIVLEIFRRSGTEIIRKNLHNDGRGWKGDVKTMRLDIQKAKSRGWKPSMSSLEAVIRSVYAIVGERLVKHESPLSSI